MFTAATQRATEFATKMNIHAELPAERRRKLPRRLDDNAGNAASMSPMNKMRTCVYVPLIDRLASEISDRFPSALIDCGCLNPSYFNALNAEVPVPQLANRYGVDVDTTASQWRLSHRFD